MGTHTPTSSRFMKAKEIKAILTECNTKETTARCSRGLSESFYDPTFLLKKFFDDRKIDIDLLDEEELKRLYDFSSFAAEIFY